MSRTTTRIGEPARRGEWGLTVDAMASPREYVLVRYPGVGKRHSEPWTVVARTEYRPEPAVIARAGGLPSGTASWLVAAVEMKLASHKSAQADQGYRPVS